MGRIILQLVALFVLPALVYVVYMAVARRRAAAAGKPVPEWERGHWYWIVMAGAVLALVTFLAFGLFDKGAVDLNYIPPKNDAAQ